MRKEVIIAIIIGFALGLVITFGVWTANRAIKETAPQKEEFAGQEAEVEEATPTPTTVTELFLTINSPENNSISDQEQIKVKGETKPQAVVVVIYQEGEKILEADENGDFETEISLTGGANEIEISAHDQEGNEANQILTVVYSTAEI